MRFQFHSKTNAGVHASWSGIARPRALCARTVSYEALEAALQDDRHRPQQAVTEIQGATRRLTKGKPARNRTSRTSANCDSVTALQTAAHSMPA
jgi:hypothetical protein